ncbi:unnamed protein product [Trichogramma brassicae]|uniref:Uncharacterized protein n=1 Tax=Trichogramma brassicae TaxID=86971 RepID=A0A6H5ISV1_9HYME|nr:unnamed protein product [Trichogramma brassicae]
MKNLHTVYLICTGVTKKKHRASAQQPRFFVLHGARHDAVSKRSGSLVQASTGRKRKAWDDVGQDPMREESRKLICQWVEDVNHATKIGRRSDNRKPLAARENTQPLVCTVQPRCVQRPASPTPSIVSARPASTIDLISGDEDDEPIIVCEIFHARRPTALPPVQRPTTPQRIRPASVLIIESPASPPISPATSPSLSLESRPPSPVRFSPTPPLSYSPISSALENYSSHEDDGASPRPSPSYSPVQSASESDNTPPGSPQFINPAWVPNEQDSDDEEIDHEVALIWGQRAFQAAADEGYFSAQSSSKHLDAFITRVLAQASERALSETPTTPTVARAPPVPSQPYAGPVRKRDRKRKFAPFFAASIEITRRMRRRRCMERVSSVWRGQSPAESGGIFSPSMSVDVHVLCSLIFILCFHKIFSRDQIEKKWRSHDQVLDLEYFNWTSFLTASAPRASSHSQTNVEVTVREPNVLSYNVMQSSCKDCHYERKWGE